MILEKIPTWGKWLAGVIVFCTSVSTMVVFGKDTVDTLITTEAERQLLQEHHNKDIQNVLEYLAEQKKDDRIQRNHREVARLQRDLVGGKYSTEGEKEFMIVEIQRIQKELLCDEQSICN